MAIVVVLIDELDAAKAAQIVESLLERESEAMSEFLCENQCPLHFVDYVVCHIRRF